MIEHLEEKAVKERDKYVISELRRLQGIAEKQEMFGKELLSRLSPVILTEQIDANAPTDHPSLGVPLADDLAGIARQFEKMNEIFEDILNRLEI